MATSTSSGIAIRTRVMPAAAHRLEGIPTDVLVATADVAVRTTAPPAVVVLDAASLAERWTASLSPEPVLPSDPPGARFPWSLVNGGPGVVFALSGPHHDTLFRIDLAAKRATSRSLGAGGAAAFDWVYLPSTDELIVALWKQAQLLLVRGDLSSSRLILLPAPPLRLAVISPGLVAATLRGDQERVVLLDVPGLRTRRVVDACPESVASTEPAASATHSPSAGSFWQAVGLMSDGAILVGCRRRSWTHYSAPVTVWEPGLERMRSVVERDHFYGHRDFVAQPGGTKVVALGGVEAHLIDVRDRTARPLGISLSSAEFAADGTGFVALGGLGTGRALYLVDVERLQADVLIYPPDPLGPWVETWKGRPPAGLDVSGTAVYAVLPGTREVVRLPAAF